MAGVLTLRQEYVQELYEQGIVTSVGDDAFVQEKLVGYFIAVDSDGNSVIPSVKESDGRSDDNLEKSIGTAHRQMSAADIQHATEQLTKLVQKYQINLSGFSSREAADIARHTDTVAAKACGSERDNAATFTADMEEIARCMEFFEQHPDPTMIEQMRRITFTRV